MVAKVSDGDGKTAVDLIGAGAVSFVVNTPEGRGRRSDGEHIRKACTLHGVACVTTVSAALAAVHGLAERQDAALDVRSLQEHHGHSLRRRPRRSAARAAATAPRSGTATLRVTVRIGSVELANPVMTASGTAGYGTELAGYLDLSALGAVVVKSLAAFEWAGNPAPRLHPTARGMLNAVGLQGPGIPYWLDHVLPGLVATGATVVASIWGRTIDEYAAAADLLAAAPPQVVAVEVNLSCPNLAQESRRGTPSSPTTPRCRPRWSPPRRRAGDRGGPSSAPTPTASSTSPALSPKPGPRR